MAIQPSQLDRLKAQLLTSGLQQKDNTLFQVINQLIDALRQSIIATTQQLSGSASGVSGQSFVTTNDDTPILPHSSQIIAGQGIQFNKGGGKLIVSAVVPFPKNGEDGKDGKSGPQGLQGIQGIQGKPGKDGTNGEDGKLGPVIQGIQGLQGIQGIPGKKGIDGEDGKVGPMGLQGPRGLPGIIGNMIPRVLIQEPDLFQWHGPDEAEIFPIAPMRETLLANRTYYVLVTGSDNNSGLVNSAAGAFLTIQKAIDTVSSKIDLGNFNVTIQVGAGTYTATTNPHISCKPYLAGTGLVTVLGDSAVPGNVILTLGAAAGIIIYSENIVQKWIFDGFKIIANVAGNSDGVRTFNGNIEVKNIDYGACARYQNFVNGGRIRINANFSITGAAAIFALVQDGLFDMGSAFTGTVTGGPFAYGTAFAYASALGIIFSGTVWVNACTGKRYFSELNSVINTFGGGALYFPGNVAGTTATGGVYA